MKPRNNKTISNINIMMIQSYTSHLLHELINTTDTPKLCDLSQKKYIRCYMQIGGSKQADQWVQLRLVVNVFLALNRPLNTSEHHLNTVSDCVQPFMARVCLLSDAHIQQIHKQTSSDIHSSAQCLQILI